MQAFEYASPSTKEQAVGLLGSRWEDSAILAGGTDLLSAMKDDLLAPRRVVDLKSIRELAGIEYSAASGLRLGALVTLEELRANPEFARSIPACFQAAEGVSSPQIRQSRHGRRRPVPAAPLLVLPGRLWPPGEGRRGQVLVPEGQNRYHAILGNEGRHICKSVEPGSGADALAPECASTD